MSQYLRVLAGRFGTAWNRFWFVPRDAVVLSVMRVATGMVALYVVASYSPDMEQFFAPGGLLPVETVETLLRPDPGSMPPRWRFSYLDYIQSPRELWLAHAAGLAVLAAYTLGLWTRLTSCLALVVVLSYVHRGPMLTSQVEPVLGMLMFYLCLGPAGRYFSIDRWLRLRRAARSPRQEARAAVDPGASTAATVVTRLMQVHLVVLYASMALGKLTGDVWWNGAAVWWLIARPQQRLVDLTWLAPHTFAVNAWTHAIVLFELAFALLIFNPLARPLLLVIAVVMWLLLVPITGMAAFAAIMLVANLCFIEPLQMRRLLRGKRPAADPPPMAA